MKKIILTIGIIIALTLIGTSAFFMFIYEKPVPKSIKKVVNNPVLSYMIVDINPAVELGVDSENIVREVTPLNEEAIIAYQDLSLINKMAVEATTTLVDTATEMGYINELSETNTVTLTTVEENIKMEALTNQVETALTDHFTRKGLATLVLTAGLNDDLKNKAVEYNISYGKMLLVNRLLNLDSTLNEADLVKLSVREIQMQIKTHIKVLIANKQANQKQLKLNIVNQAKVTLQTMKESLFADAAKEKGSPLTTIEQQQLLKENFERLKLEVEAAKLEIKMANQEKRAVNQKIRERYISKINPENKNGTTQNRVNNQS